MANAWENPTMIAAEALMHLEDSLVITNLAATDKTADFLVRPNGYAIGETVKIKTRPEYAVNEFGGSIVKQDIRESTRSMTIEKHLDVSVGVTSREKAMSMDDFSSQVIQPAIYALAEKCDEYVGTKLLLAAGLYTSDAVFGTQADMAQARKSATLQQLNTDRICLVDLDLQATLLSATYFSTWAQRGDSGAAVLNQGAMGRAMGMNFYSSLNFPVSNLSTVGTGVGVTKTAPTGTENQIGVSVLTLNAAATGTFNDGDRIYVAGLRRPLIVDGTQATPTAINLVDPITEVVPVTAAVTVIGVGKTDLAARGVIMDKSCIGYAMPMLDAPSDKPSSVLSSNGYSIRVVQGYDMTTKSETLSLDLLIGAQAYDPRRMTLLREY